jgi:hypothetical protein
LLRPNDLDLVDHDEQPEADEPEAALPQDDYSDDAPEPRDHLPNQSVPWADTLAQAHAAGTRMSMNSLGILPTLVQDRAAMQRQLEEAEDEEQRTEIRGIIHELEEAIGLAQHGQPKHPQWGHERP